MDVAALRQITAMINTKTQRAMLLCLNFLRESLVVVVCGRSISVIGSMTICSSLCFPLHRIDIFATMDDLTQQQCSAHAVRLHSSHHEEVFFLSFFCNWFQQKR
jgi:hypothetical protein